MKEKKNARKVPVVPHCISVCVLTAPEEFFSPTDGCPSVKIAATLRVTFFAHVGGTSNLRHYSRCTLSLT